MSHTHLKLQLQLVCTVVLRAWLKHILYFIHRTWTILMEGRVVVCLNGYLDNFGLVWVWAETNL